MADYKILKAWELESSINYLLHTVSSEYYYKLNLCFMIPIILFSSSVGTLGLLNANNTTGYVVDDINILSVLIGLFGYCSAMLSTIHHFLNIQKLQTCHSIHSVEYNKIAKEIKLHIYLSESHERVYSNIAEYIKQCRTKIDKLIESAPDVPNHIEEKMKVRIQELRREELEDLDELIELIKINKSNLNSLRVQSVSSGLQFNDLNADDNSRSNDYESSIDNKRKSHDSGSSSDIILNVNRISDEEYESYDGNSRSSTPSDVETDKLSQAKRISLDDPEFKLNVIDDDEIRRQSIDLIFQRIKKNRVDN